MPSHAPERIVIRSGVLCPSVFHEVAMKPLFALAVSIALLVALWVYVSIGLPSLQLIPWIGFVAWATFFAAGGGRAAIVQSLPPAIAGVLLTALTMFGVANAGGGLSALIVLVAVLAFVLVAVSGLVNAYLRLGGLGNLTSTYGLLVIGKATALIVLGVAGWLHRRATIPGLAGGPPRNHWFARLAAVEIVVMAATMGLAVALARSAPPVEPVVSDAATSLLGYPPPPPLTVAGWLTNGYPSMLWLTVCALMICLYVAGVVKLRRGGNAWPVHRTVLWLLGALLLAFLTSGGPAVYGRLSFDF
jgi:hypothetical protein